MKREPEVSEVEVSKIQQVWQTEDGSTYYSKGAAESHQKKYEAVKKLVTLISEDSRRFCAKDDQRDVRDFILENKIDIVEILKDLE